jgi:hypothetical protein
LLQKYGDVSRISEMRLAFAKREAGRRLDAGGWRGRQAGTGDPQQAATAKKAGMKSGVDWRRQVMSAGRAVPAVVG